MTNVDVVFCVPIDPQKVADRPDQPDLVLGLPIGNIVGTSIIRLVGAVLLEANDEWQLQHRYVQTEAMTELTPLLNRG